MDDQPRWHGGRAALGTPTLGLEGGDRVGELYLGATEAIEVLFGPARCELRFGELGLPLMLEITEVVLLHPLVVPVLLECLLQMHQPIAITRQLIAQLFDARNEGAIVQREGMKILVTRNELAKRLSRQQRFGGEQRTALVDVDEPPLERRPFVPELTLRALLGRERGG